MDDLREDYGVDLDGTLATYDGDYLTPRIGNPYPWAREILEGIRQRGFRVVIYTARRGPGVVEWLEMWGLMNFVDEVDQTKRVLHGLIDDGVTRFNGPEDVDTLLDRSMAPRWWEERERDEACSA